MKILNELKQYGKNINWLNFFLICLFSTSSWVSTTAIWSELPAIISDLPEHWGITSILTLLSQIAQLLIVIVFYLSHKMFPYLITYKRSIYFKLIAIILTIFFLCFYWNFTIKFNATTISIGLYIFYFCTSMLDGLSTMVYLPYIRDSFSKQYIISNYIGESVSSTVPSIIILFQNIPDNEYFCLNQTSNSSVSASSSLRFPVSTFIGLIDFFLFFCLVSFIILDKRRAKIQKSPIVLPQLKLESEEFIKSEQAIKNESKHVEIILYVLIFIVSFLIYGFLPGIQTYSTLPYGDLAFNLSINLGNLFLPFAIFLSILTTKITLKRILFEFLFGLILSFILIYIAIMSPCPPLVGQLSGTVLSVSVWILVGCVFLRLRFLITAKLESLNTNMLTLGIFTLLGQILGGIVIYLVIHIYELLKEKPNCVYDFSYCLKQK